jgi:hypothetical protein
LQGDEEGVVANGFGDANVSAKAIELKEPPTALPRSRGASGNPRASGTGFGSGEADRAAA